MWDRELLTVGLGLQGSDDGSSVARADIRSGRLFRDLQRYRNVRWEVEQVAHPSRPFASMVAARLLGRRAALVDRQGGVRPVRMMDVTAAGVRFLRDAAARPSVERQAEEQIRSLLTAARAPRRPTGGIGGPVFVRPDFSRGVLTGGSMGHVAGVVNNLADLGQEGRLPGPPTLVSFDPMPMISSGVRMVDVDPGLRFLDFHEVPFLSQNAQLREALVDVLDDSERAAFVYHRYGLLHYATAAATLDRRLPLVLEYNGSEVWIAENWGGGLRRRALAVDVEEANTAAADLIVVVSDPLRDELLARGVEGDKILVNPNGVDPERFRPDLSARDVEAALDLDGRVVVGFIGTFGRWHGAEVLADAAAELAVRRPDLEDRLVFLMIGDGVMMPEVRARVSRAGLDSAFRFTGLIPQTEGPKYLAAADILVSPHIPNADGTPFIGSPTKLFEYLAMGRAIVASDLGQIGEVLDDDTAVLVPPGDAVALADGIARLVDDRGLRDRLALGGRRRAVERHTWRRHTERIIDALEERLQ